MSVTAHYVLKREKKADVSCGIHKTRKSVECEHLR